MKVREEIEFNIDLIEHITRRYKHINSDKIRLRINNYYFMEEIRLNTKINELENKNNDDSLISKIIRSVLAIITFGFGIIVTLGNESMSNSLSQVIKSNLTNEQISANIGEIGKYLNGMTSIIQNFMLGYVIIIGATYILEYIMNNKNKKIYARGIRFNKICLEVLKQIKEGNL